jgi:hypothetical protein
MLGQELVQSVSTMVTTDMDTTSISSTSIISNIIEYITSASFPALLTAVALRIDRLVD